MARPGIELRTPDLRVRCLPDCATRPSYMLQKSSLVSSVVFEENVEVLLLPCRRRRGAKTLTFSNIPVNTEDIYLKLRLVVYFKRGTHTSRAGIPQTF